MTAEAKLATVKRGIQSGDIIPYLGPGVLRDVVEVETGAPIPATGESLILDMNNGRPMAPRLMYEFPRAAMNLEQKKGRKFIERYLTTTYGERQWSPSRFHVWLAQQKPRYVIDINRDTQLQLAFRDIPHTLVVGVARLGGTDYRFKLYHYDGKSYRETDLAGVDSDLPVLFKPMGTPLPEPNFVASDADYVDYITELMGGFAIPAFLKLYRQNKRYAFLGMDFTRDTERMVMSDIIYGAGSSPAGWVLNPNPTEKEQRYFRKKDLIVVPADWETLLTEEIATAAVAS